MTSLKSNPQHLPKVLQTLVRCCRMLLFKLCHTSVNKQFKQWLQNKLSISEKNQQDKMYMYNYNLQKAKLKSESKLSSLLSHLQGNERNEVQFFFKIYLDLEVFDLCTSYVSKPLQNHFVR